GGVRKLIQEFVSGEIEVLNIGQLASSPSSARFYLAASGTLNKATDTLLHIAPGSAQTTMPLGPFPAQSDLKHFFGFVRPFDTRIPLPPSVDGSGKHIIVDLLYTDPLTSHQSVVNYFSGGPLF